jgi:hypothetical protein
MRYKKKNLNFMKQISKYFFSALLMLFFNISFSQSSVNSDVVQSKIKIDGVSAVVGEYVILESDVDKTLIDLQSQGVSTQNITRCSLLGKLMEDKLYAHHAEQDSLEVDNNQIYSYVDKTIDYFIDHCFCYRCLSATFIYFNGRYFRTIISQIIKRISNECNYCFYALRCHHDVLFMGHQNSKNATYHCFSRIVCFDTK